MFYFTSSIENFLELFFKNCMFFGLLIDLGRLILSVSPRWRSSILLEWEFCYFYFSFYSYMMTLSSMFFLKKLRYDLLLLVLSSSAQESSWVSLKLLWFESTGIIDPFAELGILISLMLWRQDPVYSDTSWMTSSSVFFSSGYSQGNMKGGSGFSSTCPNCILSSLIYASLAYSSML